MMDAESRLICHLCEADRHLVSRKPCLAIKWWAVKSGAIRLCPGMVATPQAERRAIRELRAQEQC